MNKRREYTKKYYQENKELFRQNYLKNREKKLAYRKKYYEENKEHYKEYNKKYYRDKKEREGKEVKERKTKPVKIKVEKPVKKQVKKQKVKTMEILVKRKRVGRPRGNHYIDDIELTREIILSQAKGKLTKRGYELLLLMATRINMKFKYNREEDRKDCLMSGFLAAVESYKNFNYMKYKKSIPYFTEVIKRGHAVTLGKLHGYHIVGVRYHMTKTYRLDDISFEKF